MLHSTSRRSSPNSIADAHPTIHDDPLHPLLDLFNRAQPRVAPTQAKGHENAAYRAARDACAGKRADAPLADTDGPIIRHVRLERLIAAAPGRTTPARSPATLRPVPTGDE
jgi:hypothetical protein